MMMVTLPPEVSRGRGLQASERSWRLLVVLALLAFYITVITIQSVEVKEWNIIKIFPTETRDEEDFVFDEKKEEEEVVEEVAEKNSSIRDSHVDDSILQEDEDTNNPREVQAISSLPLPLQIIQQYKKWHSVESLQRDRDIIGSNNHNHNNRTYVLAYYQCPYAAGNRIHEFLNAMLLAIITNRTLLWKYYDPDACFNYGKKSNSITALSLTDRRGKQLLTCLEQNYVQDCEAAGLLRKSWIPSYDEWMVLDTAISTATPYSVGRNADALLRVEKDSTTTTNNNKSSTTTILHFHREILSYDWSDPALMQYSSAWSRQTARDLYSLGTSFVYGLAFHTAFTFSDGILNRAVATATTAAETTRKNGIDSAYSQEEDPNNNNNNNNNTNNNDKTTVVETPFYTVAVHSRHVDEKDSGCNVTRELDCLQSLLADQDNDTFSCHVYIMADRECTISNLRRALEDSRCTVHVANHDAVLDNQKEEDVSNNNGNSTIARHSEEHGPFAGSLFFQDLVAAAAGARHAFVGGVLRKGHWRSSSAWLLELIEYNRRIEAWQAGHDPELLQEVNVCSYPTL